MLDLAIKAKIPFIGVRTDDTINFKAVLQSIAGKKLMGFPPQDSLTLHDINLYWSLDCDIVTPRNYERLQAAKGVCVIVNPEKTSTLLFDAGTLQVPDSMIRDQVLASYIKEEALPGVLAALKGLSIKGADEVMRLTMARTGSTMPAAIRQTRLMIGGPIPGLQQLDTDYSFYVMQPELKEWIELNRDYFLSEKPVPKQLMPRGLMLEGVPGVGKSTAAIVIGREWGVPVYRLDVASMLNRYLGESEGRIARSLQQVEDDAPCVMLLDETEKLFSQGGDEGTITRLLSQLLWWLQYHRARVVTIMTTNDLSAIPPELYRPGRADRVIKMEPLTAENAIKFCNQVFYSVLGKNPEHDQIEIMGDAIMTKHKATLPHAEVCETVYEVIKKYKWSSQ